jgi:hypothetical protein
MSGLFLSSILSIYSLLSFRRKEKELFKKEKEEYAARFGGDMRL